MTINKPRILVCGAPKAYSGYSEHTRTVLRSLKSVEDKIDLYLMPYRWAQASDTYDNEEELKWIDSLIAKFNPSLLGYFDVSVQIGPPTEWKNYGRCNIGVTAGLETTTIPNEWIDHLNSMNKIITISEFSKQGMLTTKVQDRKVNVPIDVIEYPVKQFNKTINTTNFDSIKTKFNFIHVGQWAPRKNLEKMITWFIEEFKNDSDVGLILKLQTKSNSTPDRYECKRKLFDITNKYNDRKCKIYFLHGDMSDQEIHNLIMLDSTKVFVSATHGEGWGLGLFEAAYSGLPVVTPDFSGYKEFLYADKPDKNGKNKLRPYFQRVNFELKQLEPQHFMPGLLQPGMFWAYPMENDFKRKIREIYKDYGRFKKQAVELKDWIQNRFTMEQTIKKYQYSILNQFNLESIKEDIVEVE